MRTSAINLKFFGLVTLVGALGGLCLWGFAKPSFNVNDLRSISGTVAQVAATMMGFLFAALAILASIANMRLLRNLQRSGGYHVLLARILISAIYFFLTMSFSLSVMVFPTSVKFATEIGGGLLIASCYALCESTWKFAAVLFSLKPDSPGIE